MNVTIRHSGNTETLSNNSFIKLLNEVERPFDRAYSDKAHEVLSEISRHFMKSHLRDSAPQIMALGFWLRPAAVVDMVHQSSMSTRQLRIIPRGLAFHLPPSNVDTLFVYSWAISLLMGNANVIRLPSDLSPVSEYLIDTITSVLEEHQIETTQIFCSYSKENEIVKDICAHSDLRVIWGGDQKVLSLSSIPIKPDGLSIGFSDRTAMSVISSSGYNALDQNKRDELAQKYFNDIYWFDQLGCGSPRAIIWLGSMPAPVDDFFTRIQNIINDKKAHIELGTAIEKFVYSNEMLITGIGDKATRISNDITYVDAEIQEDLLDHVQGGGFLFQCQCDDITKIQPLISNRLQTITHGCLLDTEINQVADLITGTGGYRIVPVGEALSFGPVWDGLDLFNMFSRKLVINYGRNKAQ